MRQLNQASLDLIKSFEGLRLKAYKDSVGVWTIGYGHTTAAGKPVVTSGLSLTKQQAEDLLRTDLVKYSSAVERLVSVPLNDNQFGALTSFVYNVGEGNFRKSTLLKKLNASNYKDVPSELLKYNKAGGRVLNGLTRRRQAEGVLFNNEVKTVSAPKQNWLEVIINLLLKLVGK